MLEIKRYCLHSLLSLLPFLCRLFHCLLSDERTEKRVKMPVTQQQPFNVHHQPGTHILISHGKHIRDAKINVRNYFYELTPWKWQKTRQMLFWRNFVTKFFNELQKLGIGILALAEEWKVTASGCTTNLDITNKNFAPFNAYMQPPPPPPQFSTWRSFYHPVSFFPHIVFGAVPLPWESRSWRYYFCLYTDPLLHHLKSEIKKAATTTTRTQSETFAKM